MRGRSFVRRSGFVLRVRSSWSVVSRPTGAGPIAVGLSYVPTGRTACANGGPGNARSFDGGARRIGGWDARGWDARGWDARGWDARGWDARGWDARGWDARGRDARGA
jgi:hypothetical protein